MLNNRLLIAALVITWANSYGQAVSPLYNFPDSIIKNSRDSKDIVSQDLSFSGYYDLALDWEDSSRSHTSWPIPADFFSWKQENALAQISRLAKDARVVLINEGHNLPNTRSFILKVLQALKPMGFNAYATETFSWDDSALQHRAYPVDRSGYYTDEPVFGEVVREAIKLDYQLFPYEDSVEYNCNKVMLDSLGSFMIVCPGIKDTMRLIVAADGSQTIYQAKQHHYREIHQAENIINYLRAHPKARAIIHVGYGHLCRDNSYPLMGYYLDSALADKIIAIDQTSLREHSNKEFEEALYTQFTCTDYVAFINNSGVAQVPLMRECGVDIVVAHPRTKYINGRPDWLHQMPGRKEYNTNEFQKIKAPSVLVAFYEHEYAAVKEHAIAIDVLELKKPGGNPPLLLRPGKFTIIQLGRNGEKAIYDVSVKQ